jgi:hypothetical protein
VARLALIDVQEAKRTRNSPLLRAMPSSSSGMSDLHAYADEGMAHKFDWHAEHQ